MLAARLELKPGRIEEVAAAEGWVAERTKLLAEARRRALAAAVEETAEVVRRHRLVAAAIIAEVEQRMRTPSELSIADLRALGRTLAAVVPVERVAAGLESGAPATLDHGVGGAIIAIIRNPPPGPPTDEDAPPPRARARA